MKKLFLMLVLLSAGKTMHAQHFESVSFEIQIYPAGIIPGIRFDYNFENNNILNLRLGYNITRRKNWGEHDDERGGGPGFSFGYVRRDFADSDFDLSLRSDFWFMNIDWRDETRNATGRTAITVFQPIIGLERPFKGLDGFLMSPSIYLGREFNIRTIGEGVGQDYILLGGLRLGYQD